jgi:hypothetical protein
MKPHSYLRAYMAGALVPTVFVMFVVCAYAFIRYGLGLPFAIEKGIIFPVAFVPNLFGFWNVVYTKLPQKHRIALGIHGALLPFVLAPLGLLVATSVGLARFGGGNLIYFDAIRVPYAVVGTGFICALIVYYLVWKHLVGCLNEIVRIA